MCYYTIAYICVPAVCIYEFVHVRQWTFNNAIFCRFSYVYKNEFYTRWVFPHFLTRKLILNFLLDDWWGSWKGYFSLFIRFGCNLTVWWAKCPTRVQRSDMIRPRERCPSAQRNYRVLRGQNAVKFLALVRSKKEIRRFPRALDPIYSSTVFFNSSNDHYIFINTRIIIYI